MGGGERDVSIWERLLWATFGLYAVAAAVDWYRFERTLKREQRRHEADMAAVHRARSEP